MKTQTLVTRLVCGTAVLLWTGVGFADDLNSLLRLVQLVAQDRSDVSRSDRGGRGRTQDALLQSAGRTTRESRKRNDEQEWGDRALDRNSRTPSRSRGPSGSLRQPDAGRFDDRLDRSPRSDRSAFRPEYSPGPGWIEERRSAELSFSVGTERFSGAYGTPRPRPIPVPAPVPVPVPVPVPAFAPMHQVGEIVHCRVPLATCVRVRGADNICGDFVPVIVAVRDPALCEHDADRLVYVQILVPPVPPRKVEVSRCHTRVDLCFRELDVEIVSKNGMISVEYDD